MPLSSVNLTVNIPWQLYAATSGFNNVTQGPDNLQFNLAALDTDTWTQLFAEQYTIAASAFEEFDLSSFTNLVDEATSFGHVLSLLVLPTGTNAIAHLSPGSTNGLQWFFGSLTDSVSIPAGGVFVYSLGATDTGQTVTSGSSCTLRITNTGSGTLTVKVAGIGHPA